jgi:hypothetical protein
MTVFRRELPRSGLADRPGRSPLPHRGIEDSPIVAWPVRCLRGLMSF